MTITMSSTLYRWYLFPVSNSETQGMFIIDEIYDSEGKQLGTDLPGGAGPPQYSPLPWIPGPSPWIPDPLMILTFRHICPYRGTILPRISFLKKTFHDNRYGKRFPYIDSRNLEFPQLFPPPPSDPIPSHESRSKHLWSR